MPATPAASATPRRPYPAARPTAASARIAGDVVAPPWPPDDGAAPEESYADDDAVGDLGHVEPLGAAGGIEGVTGAHLGADDAEDGGADRDQQVGAQAVRVVPELAVDPDDESHEGGRAEAGEDLGVAEVGGEGGGPVHGRGSVLEEAAQAQETEEQEGAGRHAEHDPPEGGGSWVLGPRGRKGAVRRDRAGEGEAGDVLLVEAQEVGRRRGRLAPCGGTSAGISRRSSSARSCRYGRSTP
jgi:hypothetical protein